MMDKMAKNQTFLYISSKPLISSRSIVVEHLPHHPKGEGLSLAAVAYIGREKREGKIHCNY
jgi:hypothetical protein